MVNANIWDKYEKFGFQYANNKLVMKEAAVSDYLD